MNPWKGRAVTGSRNRLNWGHDNCWDSVSAFYHCSSAFQLHFFLLEKARFLSHLPSTCSSHLDAPPTREAVAAFLNCSWKVNKQRRSLSQS